jgi:NAD(P)-dependent dehydrogenase (short-subunit alcohol dehydrogenase family)
MTAIKGAAILVTGGQRGLGKALVEELLAAGAAKVYATARQPRPSGDLRVIPLQLEVTGQQSVDEVARQAGDVTIVVNNAGTTSPGTLLESDMKDTAALFDANVFGPLRVARAFAPILKRNGGGALVNIHSALSWIAGFGAYGATKAALWSVTNSLRLELASQGTTVTGVHVGWMDTELFAYIDSPKSHPRDVARAIIAGVQEDQPEVLADGTSRYFKSVLSGPVSELSPR